MSVLIKGIKMPKESWDCPCHDGETGWCKVTGSSCEPIPKDCPLVEVPTPHGRLIDADVLKENAAVRFFGTARVTDIDEQPTILESEVDNEDR